MERIVITDRERERVKNFLDEKGRLVSLPAKQSMKVAVLEYISGKFTVGRRYSRAETQEILDDWHTFNDVATLRRELCDFGFMQRLPNGSEYWLAE